MHIEFPTPVRRILLLQLRQIGDVLLSTPAVSLLAERFPEAELHFFTERKCIPVLEGNPHLTRIWPVDKKIMRHLWDEIPYYWRVARQSFDLVVDFQQLPRCRWVVAFSQARVRLSHTAPWYNHWLYTHTVPHLSGYAARTKASVLRPLGTDWDGRPPQLYLSPTEDAEAASILSAHGLGGDDILVTVDPTHRRDTRRWPAAFYGRLLALAASAEPRLKFLLLYGPGEEEDVRTVAATADIPSNVILPERMLSLRQMAACIRQARLHLGNCSSPRHFAVAVNTPTLVIHGSTSDVWAYPSSEHETIRLGLPCQPCGENICPQGHTDCLNKLAPEVVLPRLLARIGR